MQFKSILFHSHQCNDPATVNRTLIVHETEGNRILESYMFLSKISDLVQEGRAHLQKNGTNVLSHDIKRVYSAEGCVAGASFVVRANGLAEYLMYGSGRPVLTYVVGYV